MYYAMSMYNLRSNWYILLLVVCWLLGYGGTPFTYPRVTIVTLFLLIFFCGPCCLLAHTNKFVLIVKKSSQ